ncbi:hypothetical protein Q5P01_000571 [Channa striata]|uniref:Uncharacterized protein n=1 Tax=Channa striata TaxID=64152 RepID=A0AA88LEU7_CHASR|nr:hypothetical protein Q5P01_000571 [Channa striata]
MTCDHLSGCGEWEQLSVKPKFLPWDGGKGPVGMIDLQMVASIGGHLEVHDTVGHCQHGKPCAIACPSDKDGGARCGPVWFGGRAVVGRGVERRSNQGRESDDDKSRRDDRRPPEEPVPRGVQESVHGDPRGRGPAHGDPVRGLRGASGGGLFDEVFWLTSPCREEGACKNDFVGEEAGGLFERDNVNTTLVENALGDPLSKTLVLDPVVESDLKGAFFCKLESTRRNDVVSVFSRPGGMGPRARFNNGHRESEPRAATRGPR